MFNDSKRTLEKNVNNYDTQITMRISTEMREKLQEHNINASELFRQAVVKELRKRE